MAIEIRAHAPGKDLHEFLLVPHELLGDDPNWVAPLGLMMRDMLTPKKNPFFDHADVALFTARKGGKLVGRISAQVDHEHQRRYGDQLGYFGFFETIDDPEVARELLATAKRWLSQRGMKQF